jgi:hypothetical protein
MVKSPARKRVDVINGPCCMFVRDKEGVAAMASSE